MLFSLFIYCEWLLYHRCLDCHFFFISIVFISVLLVFLTFTIWWYDFSILSTVSVCGILSSDCSNISVYILKELLCVCDLFFLCTCHCTVLAVSVIFLSLPLSSLRGLMFLVIILSFWSSVIFIVKFVHYIISPVLLFIYIFLSLVLLLLVVKSLGLFL